MSYTTVEKVTALITTQQSGQVQYDDTSASSYATVVGSDGKNHRAMLTVDVGGSESLKVMPTAGEGVYGKIVQYTGETGSGYTNGYFYKCTRSESTASSISASKSSTSTGITAASVTKATFETKITTSGTYNFIYDGIHWTLNGSNVTLSDYGITVTNAAASAEVAVHPAVLTVTVDASLFSGFATETGGYEFDYQNGAWVYEGEEVTLSTYGVTVTGTPSEDDSIIINFVKAGPHEEDTVEIVYTASSYTYSWTQIDVQPGGSTGSANISLSNLNATGEAHFAKPTATGTLTSGTSTTMVDNTVYTGTSMTSITLAFPASPASTFVSEAQITTGTGTITFAVDSGTVMKGTDCDEGTFTPSASSTYSIMFGISGSSKYGIVCKIA